MLFSLFGPACLSRPLSPGPARGRSTGNQYRISPRSHSCAIARAPTRIMHRADRNVDLVRAHRSGAAAAGADPDALGAGALAMSDQAVSHCNACYYCRPLLLLQSPCCYCRPLLLLQSPCCYCKLSWANSIGFSVYTRNNNNFVAAIITSWLQ